MTDAADLSVSDRIARDHRRLDEPFGHFLGAGDREAAAHAIGEFDAALRAHMRLEEDELFPLAPPGKLVATPDETERDRLFRELRLEHVQIRELSGMIVRTLREKTDLAPVRGLAASLARRWDAHTVREERAFADESLAMDPAGEAAIREALG